VTPPNGVAVLLVTDAPKVTTVPAVRLFADALKVVVVTTFVTVTVVGLDVLGRYTSGTGNEIVAPSYVADMLCTPALSNE
jgi:hypothetical protein